jgi:hypothetical protein
MKRVLASILLLACAALFTASFFAGAPAHAEEAAAVKTIPTTEIKAAAEEAGAGIISAEEVEKTRAITAERIYWLIGLWLLIVLAAVLIRWQLRDDDKLYKEGYYSREL